MENEPKPKKKETWRNKPRKVKPDLDSKIGKYYVNRLKGMNKGDAQIAAGFPDKAHASRIEATKTYKTIDKMFYKESLLAKISLDELAGEHLKNILQDQDKGAKNTAIKMALDKIEPEVREDKDDDRIVVILKDSGKRVDQLKEAEVVKDDEDEENFRVE